MFRTRTTKFNLPDRVWKDFDDLFNAFNEELFTSYEVPKHKEFLTELPLPGLDKENISIEVSGKTLIIKTNVKTPEGFTKRYVDNSYSYYLTEAHDLNKTNAKMENGLLKITVPLKKKDETKNITIEVK